MISFDEYVKGILKQVLDSYQILLELEDKPGDLKIIESLQDKKLIETVENIFNMK